MIRVTPETWNATVYAGQTFDWTWEIKDGDGNPLNLLGVDVRAQVRLTHPTISALLSFGTGDSTVEISASAGTVRFYQSASATAALGAALYHKEQTVVFDAEAVESNGDVSRILEGTWTVKPEVTR